MKRIILLNSLGFLPNEVLNNSVDMIKVDINNNPSFYHDKLSDSDHVEIFVLEQKNKRIDNIHMGDLVLNKSGTQTLIVNGKSFSAIHFPVKVVGDELYTIMLNNQDCEVGFI